MYDKNYNYCLAYSLNVFAVPVGSILMIYAPSKMMTLAAGLATSAFSCGLRGLLSSQPDQTLFHISSCLCVRMLGDMLGSHARLELIEVSIVYLGCNKKPGE